ncbi:DUF1622 domain-containing protein [Skermanella sp. TT6]|uniref:DUF1622 domain-containing protein n=1 Tax=Skermanella cutis TaxID=2775420 RepID=A0ABX7B9M0_9PROT|nr:DUF1622 domain-containing protein [Skermanella sp. TT6]QQP89776.1 DUF1622 domain-containing protein [Skermanella sp. TT6]
MLAACLLLYSLFGASAAHAQEVGGFLSESRGTIVHIAELVTSGIEAVGIAVIVLGATIATALFIRDGFGAAGWNDAYERYRANLGRGILIGLELLVAADIIATVAAPLDFSTVGALGVIVLIRTFLSFSLEVEIKGRWPWQESRIRERGTDQGGKAGMTQM